MDGGGRGEEGGGRGREPLELRVVHLIEPGGRAGWKVWVTRAAACGQVGGGTPCHGPQCLAHPLPPLGKKTVHGEAQAVEQGGVSDGGGRLGDAVGAASPQVVVGGSCAVYREAAIQQSPTAHLPYPTEHTVRVPEVRENLLFC